jgi:hypothetical protein
LANLKIQQVNRDNERHRFHELFGCSTLFGRSRNDLSRREKVALVYRLVGVHIDFKGNLLICGGLGFNVNFRTALTGNFGVALRSDLRHLRDSYSVRLGDAVSETLNGKPGSFNATESRDDNRVVERREVQQLRRLYVCLHKRNCLLFSFVDLIISRGFAFVKRKFQSPSLCVAQVLSYVYITKRQVFHL